MLVHGFGVNDADYEVKPVVDGKQVRCHAYESWCAMLRRVFDDKYQQKHKTYIGTTICDEWRSFMAFREWWLRNYVDGWHLDKDLLTDDRQYSPDKCLYVPAWLNIFTTGSDSNRGKFPIGVSYEKSSGLFEASCNNPETGRKSRVGRFKTPEAAHLAWRARKLEYAAQMKNEMDAIDERIYHRVVDIINRAK